MADRPYSVSEITQIIKGVIEQTVPPVWVAGEVSQYIHHTSGHRYFTLKDAGAQLKCVMFRGAGKLSFEPETGMQVLAFGTISVYERTGQHQLYATQLFPAGAGAAAAALEALKARLTEEGLFATDRKRSLPRFPACVGVVTSATGAAIRDIVTVVGRRAPWVSVVLSPARVQGEGSALEVVAALEALNAWGLPDVLIVGRGGGASEDLSAFNDERVVRAVFGSRLPVISAVGHEVDVTLSDLAADCRAPTPSAAAELAVPDRGDLLRQVGDLRTRSLEAVERMMEDDGRVIDGFTASYGLRRLVDRLDQHAQEVDDMESDLRNRMAGEFRDRVRDYRDLTGLLDTLSPLNTLTRGYSICQRLPDGRVVRNSAELDPGQRVRVRFAKGEAICEVEERSST